MGLFGFLKKNRSFTVEYHLEDWIPKVSVPVSYDKLFSLKILLQREGIVDFEAILASPNPLIKAKQLLSMPSKDERDYPFSEGAKRMRRIISLGTIDRGSPLELIDLFAYFMVYRFASDCTWDLRTGKPNAEDFYESFLRKMAGSDNRAIQLIIKDDMIACLADMILRSKLTLKETSDRMCKIIRHAASEEHSAGTLFIKSQGVEKIEALLKRSLQAFFQEGRQYSLSTLLLKDILNKTDTKKTETQKESEFSFDLCGTKLGSSEKGVFYSIVGNDKTKVLAYMGEINRIFSEAHKTAGGFPKTTVNEKLFRWIKNPSFNPSLIISSTVTATGRKPKYPYIIELFREDEKGQVILSILPDGRIGRLEAHLFSGEYSYELIASTSKDQEVKFSKIAKTSMKTWKETRWV